MGLVHSTHNRRTEPRPGRSRTLAAAATALVVLGAGGCGFDPVREVSSQATPDPDGAPETLAFAADDTTRPAAAPVASDAEIVSEADRPVDLDLPAGTWRVATDTTVIGVYSGPDSIYTRIGVLEPDDLVLATGKRVSIDGVIWMEISWDATTAWVLQVAFTPTPSES